MFLAAAICIFISCFVNCQYLCCDAFAAIQRIGGNMVKKKKLKGFTLLEMMVVLFVISILLLLFVPNIMKQKDSAKNKSDESIVKVVETQMEVYELETGNRPTLEELADGGYITDKQKETYEKAKP